MSSYIMMVCYNIIAMFWYYEMGVLKTTLTAEFSLTPFMFSMLSGSMMFAFTLMQIPLGILLDKYSVKKIASAGLVVEMIGTGLMLFTSPVTLIVGRFIQGMACAVGLLCIFKVCATKFDAGKYATLSGLGLCLSYIGSMTAQSPLANILHVMSWRTVTVIGLILEVVLLIVIRIKMPEDVPVTAVKKEKTSLMAAVKKVRVSVWLNLMICGLLFGGFGLITGVYGTDMIVQVCQYSTVKASLLTSLAIVGCCAGNLFVGVISDALHSRKGVQLVFASLYTISLLILWRTFGHLPYGVFCVLMLVMGVTECAYITCYTIAKEDSDEEMTALVTSIVNIGAYLGSFGAVVIAGVVEQMAGETLFLRSGVFGITILCAILAVIFTVMIPVSPKKG